MDKNQKLPATAAVADWRLRVVLVIVGLGLWFSTQSLLGLRPRVTHIRDHVLELTGPAHHYLATHNVATDLLLVVSSLVIDMLGVFLLAWSIFGPSVRPFLGLLILFLLRQICQATCELPEPPGSIWHRPFAEAPKDQPAGTPAKSGGVPSLLVTYDVGNDFFFSGHTAIAVYGAVELIRLRRRLLAVLAVGIAAFEILTVILLRSHWTMDVYAGIITALFVAGLAARIAPAWDRRLAAVWPQK